MTRALFVVATVVAVAALPACSSAVGSSEAAAYWTAYYEAQAEDRATGEAAAGHNINPLAWTAAAEKAIGIDVSPRRRTEWLDWTRVNRRQEYDARADAAQAYVKRRLARVAATSSVEALLRIAQSDTGAVAQAALDAALKAGAAEKHAEAVAAARTHIASVTAVTAEAPSATPAPSASGA